MLLALAACGVADAASSGISTQQARTAAPGAVNVSGATAAEGTSLAFARADHVHSLSGTLPIGNGGTNATSSSAALANLGGVSTSRLVSTTSPLAGGGALSSDLTLSCQTASGSQAGCLSSTDWTTFNNKQPAGSYLTAVTTDSPLSGSGTSGSHLVLGTVPASKGGTNLDTSASTGVPSISAGTWSVASTLAASKGGTGGDSSASTGLAKVSSGTWSYATLVDADVSSSAAIAVSKLANGSATSVLARSASTSGAHADLAASADGQVLQRASGALTWATVPNAALANSSVTVTASTGLGGGGAVSLGGSVSLNTDSTQAGFLSSGALTCGASTAGKVKVHTTPLQYCDNAATPALQYAAYGDSSGRASALASGASTNLASGAMTSNGSTISTGTLTVGNGGTGATSFGAAAGALVTSGASGTGAMGRVDAVATGSILISQGTGTNPAWQSTTSCSMSSATTCTVNVNSGCTPRGWEINDSSCTPVAFRVSVSTTTLTVTAASSNSCTFRGFCF